MAVTEKRRLLALELAYYCALVKIKPDEIAEGWIDARTGAVELVRQGFIDRVIFNAGINGEKP